MNDPARPLQKRLLIGVIGAARASAEGLDAAYEVGRLLAEQGAVVVCGGLGGVMEAACRGCVEAGGLSVGILPGADAAAANPYVVIPVVTAIGHARNVVIAQTARALIAVEGEYGTLSEIAVGLKLGRPVMALGSSWGSIPGVTTVSTPAEAVRRALAALAH